MADNHKTWPYDGGPFIIYNEDELNRIANMVGDTQDLAARRVLGNHIVACKAMKELHAIQQAWKGGAAR